ncbi:MAG: transcription elongation factor GreA [Gammaproteobacteria bacterium]|nr:transcription elongation factor GreA [Gammaproteobacteria bacterium]
MSQVPMTVNGAEKLRAELQKLKSVERPRIINAIAEARALGDLKENAEYHAAKEQQSFIEGRIASIESKLGNARIIDITTISNTGRVIFGVTVTLLNLLDDKEVRYTIVGDDEADIKQHKISISSPIARGLIGKNVGDEVVIHAPNGSLQYELINVEHI